MGIQNSLPITRQDNLVFPPEILEEIIRDFTGRDILVAREVCNGWKNYADSIIETRFRDKVTLCTEDSEERTRLLMEFENRIPWSNYSYKSVLLTKHSLSFWNLCGDNITRLDFYDCTFPTLEGTESGKISGLYCSNLMHLGIRNCGKYLMMGKSYFHLHKLFNLKNLKSLDVSSNSYLNDYALTSLLRESDALQSLNVAETKMTFTKAVFRRFYPQLKDLDCTAEFEFSDCVLTFQALYLSFLSTDKANSLEEIIFDNTRIDSSALQAISDSEVFKWRKVCLNSCSELKPNDLKTFLLSQKFIRHLEIGRSKANFSDCFKDVEHMKALEYLCLSDNQSLGVGDFFVLMPRLRYLDISYCMGLPLTTLDFPVKSCLRTVNMRSMVPSNVIASVSAISEKLMNLTVKLKSVRELDLGCCGSVVTDDVLQSIIVNMKQLEILKLCQSKISDKGTTGIDPVKGPRVLSSPYFIAVKQMQVKQDVVQVAESETSFGALSNLQTLSLSGCRELGEPTWTLALKLCSLRKLDISYCSQISLSGFKAIVKNCCQLEELAFMHCGTHITQNAQLIEELRAAPRRLRKLLF